MMKIKTKLGMSSISGIGLFADQFVPKNSIVWELDVNHDKIYTEEQFQSSNDLDKDFLITYCFKYNGKYILCVDNARFFNHAQSAMANCYSSDYNETCLGYTRATRDIFPGEELADDNSHFGFSDDDNLFNMNESLK